MHEMMSSFSGQLWFRKKKKRRLSSVTSKHGWMSLSETGTINFYSKGARI